MEHRPVNGVALYWPLSNSGQHTWSVCKEGTCHLMARIHADNVVRSVERLNVNCISFSLRGGREGWKERLQRTRHFANDVAWEDGTLILGEMKKDSGRETGTTGGNKSNASNATCILSEMGPRLIRNIFRQYLGKKKEKDKNHTVNSQTDYGPADSRKMQTEKCVGPVETHRIGYLPIGCRAQAMTPPYTSKREIRGGGRDCRWATLDNHSSSVSQRSWHIIARRSALKRMSVAIFSAGSGSIRV